MYNEVQISGTRHTNHILSRLGDKESHNSSENKEEQFYTNKRRIWDYNIIAVAEFDLCDIH